MDRLFKSGRKVLYVIVLLSVIIPGVILTYYLINSGKYSVSLSIDSTFAYLLLLYYSLLIIVATSVAGVWLIRQIKFILTLKNEKINSEMMLLKSEVSPHFFFNMLNNIYAMVETDTILAKRVIMELSDLMRYSIYEGKKEEVVLQQEIDFINNYIELHKVRYHRKIDVQFEVGPACGQQKVTPLLFIILVENAFKHGVETISSNAFVHVNLSCSDDKLLFEIKNNFDFDKQKKQGIGLKNLKRRLKLLYQDRSALEVLIEGNVYYAKLEIPLL